MFVRTRSSNGQPTSYAKTHPKRIRCKFPVFPVRSSAQLDREVSSPEKWAIQATMCRPKLQNSLKISLFAGISLGEEFDEDCAHRHFVSAFIGAIRELQLFLER